MKKSIKRTLSLLLALTMVLSLGLPAYAVGVPEDDVAISEEPAVKTANLPIGAGKQPGIIEEDESISEDLIVDIVDEETVVEEEAAPAKDFEYIESATGFSVVVSAPAGALPLGTEMVVDRLVDLRTVQNAVDNAENLNGSVRVAADISFWLNGEEIEPAEGSKLFVRMSAPEIEGIADPVVIHVPDGVNAVPEIVDQLDNSDYVMMADTVEFVSSDFSVYAVIDEGETGEEARLKVIFKNGDTEIASMLVKKADTTDTANYDKVVYDPGVGELPEGQLFRGWTMDQNYTAQTKPKDIDQIRDDIAQYFVDNTVKEGDEYVVYAMIYHAFTVTYKDGENISIGSETLLVPTTQASVDYTINQAYTAPDGEHHFEGWLVVDGADKLTPKDSSVQPPYPNGTEVTLTGSVVFAVDAPEGNWLVFHENGGTYVAAQFIRSGKNTARPTIQMKRQGYTFDDWYADEALTTKFTFGSTINTRTHVYAKWDAATTANYTVLIWKQNVAGNGYDFAASKTLSGTVGNTINLTTSTNSATVDGETYSWTGFTFNRYETGKTIAPEGNTVVNVYFNRITVTLKFYRFNATGYERSNDNTPRTGVPYYGRSGNNWSGYNYFRVYYYEGDWIYESGGSYYYYTGNRYIRTGSWTEITNYRTSGLYGSSLADNNYTWKTDYNWYSDHYDGGGVGGTRTTFLDAYLPSDGAATVNFYGEAVEGNVPIRFYKQNADDDGYTLTNTVYGTAGSKFFITDKYNGFHAAEYAVDGGTRQGVGEKEAATGYYNGGEGVTYNTQLNIYFDRDEYSILFVDGAYVDGNNNPVTSAISQGTFKTVTGITYGASTASYNADGANYYNPTEDNNNANFIFGGWYIDDQCQQPYTFTTMPEGITVYAKWVQAQYRIFLRPQVDKSDISLDWGNADQQMNFRRSVGDQISVPDGTRDDFELVGWFFDPDGENPFNTDTFFCNDNTITDTYDKTASAYMTDNKATRPTSDGGTENVPINKWGLLDDEGINKDVPRNWITHKLDLYAVWRAKIPGALGIGILYDAGEGSNPPTSDTLKYVDKAKAVAQGASTAPTGKRFLYWNVQKWNGSDWENTGVTVYPGDTFTVLKADSREQDITDGTQTATVYKTYTIRLLAEYGQAEAPDDTYIKFFANNGTEQVEDHEYLQINEAILIPTPEKYNPVVIDHSVDDPNRAGETTEAAGLHNNGQIFLGWAKLDKRDGKLYKTGTDIEVTDTTTLTEADLWLKWFEAEGSTAAHYEYTDKAVTMVAADEADPYQDLYAVWQKTFFIYHTATGKVDRIVMTSDVDTINLTELVNTDSYLYGGYYKAYSGASDTFKADPAEMTWETVTAQTTDYEGNKKINDYVAAGIVSRAVDDGDKYVNTANIAAAEWGDAYTQRGDVVTPANDFVNGQALVYYIKEVPIENYLRPNIKYTYSTSTKAIGTIWVVSGVDADAYVEAGFKIGTVENDEFTATKTLTTTDFADSLVFKANNTGATLTCTYANQCSSYGIETGKLYYATVFNDPDGGVDGAVNELKNGDYVQQYWKTPDGAIVTGKYVRAYEGIEKSSTLKPVNATENKGCVGVGSTITFS